MSIHQGFIKQQDSVLSDRRKGLYSKGDRAKSNLNLGVCPLDVVNQSPNRIKSKVVVHILTLPRPKNLNLENTLS
jgi:hypothetical protein